MLTHEMLRPLAVFALLESGCKEVCLVKDSVVGVEGSDPPRLLAVSRQEKRELSTMQPGPCGQPCCCGFGSGFGTCGF